MIDRSFTVECKNGLLQALTAPCHVSLPFNPANGIPDYPKTEFKALWDTGAVNSVITPPRGQSVRSEADEAHKANTYTRSGRI